jgi:hypothetical protein
MEAFLAIAAVSIPLGMNLWATRLVFADASLSKNQLGAQLAVVWLLPFFGAILAMGVHRKDEPPSRKYRTESDPGDDYTLSGKFVQKTAEILDGD